jgi:hypothetical protein
MKLKSASIFENLSERLVDTTVAAARELRGE